MPSSSRNPRPLGRGGCQTYAHTQSDRQKRHRQNNPSAQEPPQIDVRKTSKITIDDEQTHQTYFERGIAKQPREDKTIEKVEDHNFEFNPLEQSSGGVLKSMLRLNEAIIDVKEG